MDGRRRRNHGAMAATRQLLQTTFFDLILITLFRRYTKDVSHTTPMYTIELLKSQVKSTKEFILK